MSGTCFDCVYWHRETPRREANYYSAPDRGECRIDAPARVYPRWPTTDRAEWCGRIRRRGELVPT